MKGELNVLKDSSFELRLEIKKARGLGNFSCGDHWKCNIKASSLSLYS